jgi:hypothetical protein
MSRQYAKNVSIDFEIEKGRRGSWLNVQRKIANFYKMIPHDPIKWEKPSDKIFVILIGFWIAL